MGRVFGAIASFISVVAGCVALVGWLDTQDVPLVVIAGVIWAIALCLIGIRALFFGVRHLGGAFAATGLATTLITLLDRIGVPSDIGALVIAPLIFAAAAGPLAYDLYKADQRRRKKCLDCAELVWAEANVCRHCGYRFTATRDPTPSA